MAASRKVEWQRRKRREFAAANGYSQASDYGCGGLRKVVLERDGYRCVRCGMTDAEHRALWGRPITIDHKDRNRQRNVMENLQTLCLRCHGNKDLIATLRAPKASLHKTEILALRNSGKTYQQIADQVRVSIGAVHKWVQRWRRENV